jgi:hypothetical protein
MTASGDDPHGFLSGQDSGRMGSVVRRVDGAFATDNTSPPQWLGSNAKKGSV